MTLDCKEARLLVLESVRASASVGVRQTVIGESESERSEACVCARLCVSGDLISICLRSITALPQGQTLITWLHTLWLFDRQNTHTHTHILRSY